MKLRPIQLSGPGLAISAMVCVQIAAAAGTTLFDQLTPAGVVWLRTAIAAIIGALFIGLKLKLKRSRRRKKLRLRIIAIGTLLGLLIAASTGSFALAISRLPLGTAVAIEFLGPIAVSAITIGSARGLVWPLAAAIGVFFLTSPWRDRADTLGLAWAVVAAIAWAGYILVAERAGSGALGIEVLAVALVISAATLAPWGASAAFSAITPAALVFVCILALLMPLYAYAAEILALQRMATTSFATLTAVEPAIATLVGVMQLHQYPTLWQAIGMGWVVVAGVGASRTSRRL